LFLPTNAYLVLDAFRFTSFVAVACAASVSLSALASEQAPTPKAATEAAAKEEATTAFKAGTALVSEAKWAEALAAFERANGILPHAITLFNIGVCERALGRYTAARKTFNTALLEDESGRTQLPVRLKQDIAGFLQEIEGLLVRVAVTVKPGAVSLAVDGRPLWLTPRAAESSEPHVLVAGLLPAGKGAPLPDASFVLEMDSGRHVLTFSRAGHSDSVVAKDFVSGKAPPLEVSLDELPATIAISADQPGAIVTVEGRDFGPVPVTLQRPAGSYRVVVEKDGFVTSEALLNVKAGEESDFLATLPVYEPAITETWWFWTLSAVAVTGVGIGTYFLVEGLREPERATIGAGSLGWRVPLL
jgi:hypothetical protein